MAGMAWTLHPALFYEKYGTVLVQLWESGALGTLFRPVRRLSKGIGDRITSLRLHGTVAAPPKTEAKADAEVLTLTDESVATDDEALSRVNREPGDTSPEPSTSQQNELAFQGDIYTQMRRSRRQRERLLKIRETREKFLEGGSASSGSVFGRKRRGVQARRSSIMALKDDKKFRNAAGGGTPLTDMEGVAPTRAVVIDVSSGSPASEGSSEDEDDAAGVTRKRRELIKPEELLADNDSLQTFKDVCSPRKKGLASPPPGVHGPSESQTETASLTSTAAADQAAVCNTPPPKKVAEPFAGAKSPRKSALHKRKASRRASVVSRSAGGKVTKPAPAMSPSVATMNSSSAVAGKASPPQGDFSSATSLLSTKEPITCDKRTAPASPAESVAKKDKAKRRKPKARSRRKKAREKLSKAASGAGAKSPATLEASYTGGDVDSGAVSEDKPRRKQGTAGTPSQDKERSRVARPPIASRESSLSTGATAHSQAAEAARSDASAQRQSSAGKGSHLGAKTIKQDRTVTPKTAVPHGLKKRTASKREERIAEAKPSAQTPVDAPRSSEAVGISAAVSREETGVHKRHAKKHRTSKSPARVVETSCGAATSARDTEPERPSTVTPRPAASPGSAERVFDEVVAVRHHRRRSHGGSNKHAKEDDRRRRSTKAKGHRPVESTSPATGGELPSATLANVTADVGGGPSRVKDCAAATARTDAFADLTTSVVSAPSPRSRVVPPTADGTLSGTDTMFSLGGERRPPRATTAVRGDDVTVHMDLTSRNRAAMFWPFGRRGHKKKK